MGNRHSVLKIGFEDVNYIRKKGDMFIIISTLRETEQKCLIKGTICPDEEVDIINTAISNPNLHIVIYGKNCTDEMVYKKYNSLIGLGFTNVFVYPGGLFEWLCLQDIYGCENFETTSQELDILKFKPAAILNKLLLTNTS